MQQTYLPLSAYYPDKYNPHHFDTVGGGSGGGSYYISPIIPTSHVFWSGTAIVIVQ